MLTMEYQNMEIFAVAFACTVPAVGLWMQKNSSSAGPSGFYHRTPGLPNHSPKRRRGLLFWVRWTALFSFLCYVLLELSIPCTNTEPFILAGNRLMHVFQVYQPPPTPPSSNCRMLLMDHIFAFSYGRPFVGSYHPPACPFNSVSMTLSVTSRGRQFDRLALMFLGDVEVFRTSTAEPTADGIGWTYTKDMTPYLSLWRQPQELIFDLGNLVDETYTGTFNATLTATFFQSTAAPQTANLILPISSQRSARNASSAFSLPSDDATVSQRFPADVSRAIVSISACGQATEEFWYSNVLSSDTDTFLNMTGPLYGFSPFREVQLLIDGYPAGVMWPFPMIFTGGIAPGFWRPIVGIDAFDLRESEIDITPWVPWLSDGKEHRFQIRMAALDSQGENATLSDEIGAYWVVTGKILVFLNAEGSMQRNANEHGLPSIFAPDPAISARSSIGKSANGTNETLSYSVKASRNLVITSKAGSWVQNLEYINDNFMASEGLTQQTTQYTKVNSAAINFSDARLSFSVASAYPLSVNTTIGIFPDNSGISIDASISRGLEIDSTGRPDRSLFTLVPGESKLKTSQFGTAHYSSQPNRSYSFGDTTQDFVQSSRQGLSMVHVEAVNGSVALAVDDAVQSNASTGCFGVERHSIETMPSYRSLRSLAGRGPGRSRCRLP